ncbi:MAG TPA: DUF58 domain-containing protein [Gaiellaceae bacterium]|nr:DUF58 domain-containing protein [Gaiellaceae bacterium]HET9509432.1 DUF58 domain-containing protein [Gaiellaceae bacterium]
MLTDRGRWILALGGGIYLTAWAFGSEALYPVALGLVLAVLAAALWVRLLQRPMTLRRRLDRGDRLAGDDVPVQLELDAEGLVPSGTLVLRERIARLGERETPLVRRHGRLRGRYVLRRVPRGRYAIEASEIVIEDPFGLERVEVELPSQSSILVYPRLVDVDRLFSESGARTPEGRRLLMRRPSGFDLHSVREYEQGESLRRVHWPSTAKRGQLMVKELEDSPRDETAVLLDADAATVVGEAPESSFELAVRAAGSILKSHASRGRRAALIVNGARPVYQRVHTFDGDWHRALEVLAGVEPDGRSPVVNVLADEAGPASRAVELTVVTSVLSARLVERLVHRALGHHGASLVYVEAASFARPAAGEQLPVDAAAQILRLHRAGVPVVVLRRGDDLAARLGAEEMRAVG